MSQWRITVFESLKSFDAPRVMSLSELIEYAKDVAPDINERKAGLFIEQAASFGLLTNVRHGIWLNNNVFPTPTLSEAAHRIRKGAIVSLHTVLSDAGVLNNFTAEIYSVVPIPEAGTGPKPNLGTLEGGGTNFHFKGIKQSVLEAGDEEDRIVPMLAYDRATPEAAIVHWMYLAHARGSSMNEPDTQCDMEQLDLERLERLATAAGLHDKVFSWVERCRVRETADDDQTYWQPGM